MGRPNDILIPPDTRWLTDPAAVRLCAAVSDAGYDLFFVGGCVRNALLGLPDSDVDMSTNALPDEVMEIADLAGFRAVPTGIEHGTVTVVVDNAPFEITTYRRDVATDGRRAVVAFSDKIMDDALRRDFTMNALYADSNGRVIDPLNGLPDLLARRVRFIEDPDARIQEDYLRILRFFRFSAWYADTKLGFDPEALAAIAANTAGLETLSAERVGQEMWKLCAASDPAPALAIMRRCSVLNTILPGADDRLIAILVHIENALGLQPDPINRLAALGGDNISARLRLSKANSRALLLRQEMAYAGPALREIAYRHGQDVAQGVLLIRAALAEKVPEIGELETIVNSASATFPINSSDLMPAYKGAALGGQLKALEQKWIDSGFQLSAAELLRST